MMDQTHVFSQIPDYVLGLLPEGERRLVEQHAAACAQCRHRLHSERHLARSVRTALAAFPQPTAAHLAWLRPPAPPASRPPRLAWPGARRWAATRRLAAVALMLLLLAGSVGLVGRQRRMAGGPLPAHFPTLVAVTATASPTHTVTPLPAATPVALVIPWRN